MEAHWAVRSNIDKLFFFFSYQGTRTRSGEFVNTGERPPPPSAREISGASGESVAARPNVTPATPFPGGIIPASRLDPVAQSLLKTIPLPNTPDGSVQASASATQDSDEYLSKGDYLLNAAHRLMVSVFLIRGNGTFPFTTATEGSNLPGFGVATVASQRNVVVNETWTIGPALINQFAFNYSATRPRRSRKTMWAWRLSAASLPHPPRLATAERAWHEHNQWLDRVPSGTGHPGRPDLFLDEYAELGAWTPFHQGRRHVYALAR